MESDTVFRASDFLEMEDTWKKFWLSGAMSALYSVLITKDEDQSRCVADWYFSEDLAEKNSLIIASMEKYPHATPSAVLIALTQRECGDYYD